MSAYRNQPFILKWFDPRTGTYYPAFKDTIVVPSTQLQAQNTGYGYPPGMSKPTDWTDDKNWILILRHAKYSGIRERVAGTKTRQKAITITGRTVCFSLSARQQVTMDLMRVDGKKVRTLYNGVLSAGTYAIAIPQAGLARGVYLVALTQQGMSSKKVERYVKQ
jgi:hypothetical protein